MVVNQERELSTTVTKDRGLVNTANTSITSTAGLNMRQANTTNMVNSNMAAMANTLRLQGQHPTERRNMEDLPCTISIASTSISIISMAVGRMMAVMAEVMQMPTATMDPNLQRGGKESNV